MVERLGPALATRKLHFFFLLDVSGSMAEHGKIGALNEAMRAALPAIQEAEDSNPGVEVLVRAVAFSEHAWWHIVEPTPVDQLVWVDLVPITQGVTETGLAIDLVTKELRAFGEKKRALPPAIVLVSDGQPTTYKEPHYEAALAALLAEFWGGKAARMAIGIGRDADMDSLAQFIANPAIAPLHATRAAELTHYLKWASTVAVDASSRLARAEVPRQGTADVDLTRLPAPGPTDTPVTSGAPDVWNQPTVIGGAGSPPPPPIVDDDAVTW